MHRTPAILGRAHLQTFVGDFVTHEFRWGSLGTFPKKARGK